MMELFEFLLELLTRSSSEPSPVSWEGSDGEFMVLDYYNLAMLWGLRKKLYNHGAHWMREKLETYSRRSSRILSSVEGKRDSFKFDLELLIEKVIIEEI